MTTLYVMIVVAWLCFVAGYVIGLRPQSWRDLLFPR